jgi:predicted membrane-bound spermidine synthase
VTSRSVLRPSVTSAIVPLFFLSGACGLVYQVLWLRLLGLVFGVTVYAASTVWASFMAGLAIGSLVGGRLGDRVRRAASVPALLPTCVLLGIAFPIGLRLWAGAEIEPPHIASRTGVFYSLNVLGAILGPLSLDSCCCRLSAAGTV